MRAGVAVVVWLCVPLLHAAPAVEFNRDIRPILSDRCYTCHGPDAANRKTKLRFDIEAAAMPAIVAGDPSRSELFRRITSTNAATRMPPAYLGHDKLPDRDIDIIRQWIEQGAKWQPHWSLIAPKRPAAPDVKDPAWSRNPIDRFILARLDRDGLKPSPEADPTTLIRRVTLDLTGLPPTPREVDDFLKDKSPDAYDKLVDRLLASPRYAERMAIRWLEAARYADTNGYQSDGERSMWRWRDWVVNAFDRNMPFDRFTIEQIAGDMLANATTDQKIASAFHRNHRTSAEGGIVEEEFRTEYVADRVDTTSVVWLGLTLGCARCHDHKYDPFLQKEFYQLFAYFNNLPERGLVYNWGNEEPFIKAPTDEQSRRLAELDRRQADAERHWESLQSKIQKTQREWESKIAEAPFDWEITNGRLLYAPLDSGAALVPGQINNAVRLDGKSFVSAGDIANFNYLEPFTLAAWIKPESATGAVLSRTEDWLEGEGYGLYLMDGKLRLHFTKRWTDISLRVETEDPIKLGEWQHVLVSYDGYRKASGVSIYVDGRPKKLKVLFDELTWPIGAKEPFRIGAGGGDKYNYRGAIDEVRVWRRALSADEAAIVPLSETVSEIAAMKPEARSKPQEDKLRFCFLDRFAPAEIRDAQAALTAARNERRKYYESIQTVMVMHEGDRARQTHILKRGAYDAPGEIVSPGVPSVLPRFNPEWSNNRLGLAKWLVDRSNPLTARVTVNRFWQMLFGVGIVKTSEDFGSQGEWPVHPDLLDWLAVEFTDSGWNVKGILKTIVTSATYRQSSKATPELLRVDPENRLLARGPRLRLSAEIVRDQALAVSGLLVEKLGGPPVRPYQPTGLWQELFGGRGYQPDKGEGLYRRSVYTYWKRTVAPPSMITFDSPTRETCNVRETRTNTPLQALTLMNDVTYVEAARKLAERMMKEGGRGEASRLAFGFRLALARAPRANESEILLTALHQFRTRYAKDREAAEKLLTQGESQRDAKLKPVELAAYASVASLILNLDEAITKE